jgi:hypothetical protein
MVVEQPGTTIKLRVKDASIVMDDDRLLFKSKRGQCGRIHARRGSVWEHEVVIVTNHAGDLLAQCCSVKSCSRCIPAISIAGNDINTVGVR